MIGVLQSIIERCSSTLDTNGAYNCNGVVDKQREDCGWAGGEGEDEDQYRCCTVLYCTVLYCTVLYYTVLYNVLCRGVLDRLPPWDGPWRHGRTGGM